MGSRKEAEAILAATQLNQPAKTEGEIVMASNEVTTIRPIDISNIRTRGVQAIALLATSLGWQHMQRHSGPLVLRAADGAEIRLATDGSMNAAVFAAKLATIGTHTDLDSYMPTHELIHEILRMTKLSVDGQRVLNNFVDRIDTRVVEALEARQPKVPDEPHIVEIVPHKVNYGVEGYYVLSEAVNDRVWSDGHIDFLCQVCDAPFEKPTAIGTHWANHIRAGEAKKATPLFDKPHYRADGTLIDAKMRVTMHERREAKKAAERAVATAAIAGAAEVVAGAKLLAEELMPFPPPPPSTVHEHIDWSTVKESRRSNRSIGTAVEKLNAIYEIIGGDEMQRLRDQVDNLAHQLADSEARRAKLQADLNALGELFRDIKEV
jgi:hypothetical protein